MGWQDLVHIRLIEREYMTKLVDNVRYDTYAVDI